ncbi:MAG: hypothetical protein FD130_182 [Halothiobacillaceae bacterium]|nr:MAG: hypothetical protein FD130_182 [Halothiobacillaceae bacterium]
MKRSHPITIGTTALFTGLSVTAAAVIGGSWPLLLAGVAVAGWGVVEQCRPEMPRVAVVPIEQTRRPRR